MVFEREKTEKTNGDRELARTEKSLLYALSIRAATERNRNGYYHSGGSNPSPSAKLVKGYKRSHDRFLCVCTCL